jgi:ankyrin repeat protein
MRVFILSVFAVVLLTMAVHSQESLDDFREAIKAGDMEKVEMLVKRHRTWVNAEFDDKPTTPVSMAIAHDNPKLLEFLLKKGAKADSPNINYRPPIFAAISTGDKKLVRLLLDHGAKVNGTDFAGQTPAKYAEVLEQDEIESLIRQYGGR